uniref:Uncharacterized protein n=1 Tax=Caenorhabditis japonica TaxID=281687 RepID=A0A8R1IR23_CAEJA
MLYNRRKLQNLQNLQEYDLKSRYLLKNNMHSATMVSIISIVQTLFYAVYIFGRVLAPTLESTEKGVFYANPYSLWFYVSHFI